MKLATLSLLNLKSSSLFISLKKQNRKLPHAGKILYTLDVIEKDLNCQKKNQLPSEQNGTEMFTNQKISYEQKKKNKGINLYLL